MRSARLAPGLTAAALAGLVAPTLACELVLSGSRSGQELARLPLSSDPPSASVAFRHSVLGTTVTDHYVWRSAGGRWRAHLIEENFEGQGYGLAHAAGAGETLTRDGPRWRLLLDRLVDPLQVLPLPALGMQVSTAGRPPLLLGDLATRGGESVRLDAEHCLAR